MPGARSSRTARRTPSSSARFTPPRATRERYWIERSKDGRTIYFRPGPAKRWDACLDWTHGAAWLFRELEAGQGAFYVLTPA